LSSVLLFPALVIVFDSKTGELVGRTIFSWLKLLLFYIIFCLSLSCLWGLCMGIFFQVTNPSVVTVGGGGRSFQNWTGGNIFLLLLSSTGQHNNRRPHH
jgi:hypothetical protein